MQRTPEQIQAVIDAHGGKTLPISNEYGIPNATLDHWRKVGITSRTRDTHLGTWRKIESHVDFSEERLPQESRQRQAIIEQLTHAVHMLSDEDLATTWHEVKRRMVAGMLESDDRLKSDVFPDQRGGELPSSADIETND